jgi:hypothetical protein
MEEASDSSLWTGKYSIALLEGSQASLDSPSDKNCLEVKTSEWLEAMA